MEAFFLKKFFDMLVGSFSLGKMVIGRMGQLSSNQNLKTFLHSYERRDGCLGRLGKVLTYVRTKLFPKKFKLALIEKEVRSPSMVG